MILHTIHTTAPVLVVLVDPDKDYYRALSPYLPLVDMVFVGGSTGGNVDVCVAHLRQYTTAPIVLFPGNIQQFTASVHKFLHKRRAALNLGQLFNVCVVCLLVVKSARNDFYVVIHNPVD